MTNLSAINRRRHERIPFNADYQLRVEGREYSGKVENISLSGAFLTMPEPELTPLVPNQTGDLTINIGGDDAVFRCEIVYVGKSNDKIFPVGVGVAFCDFDEKMASAIWNLVVGHGIVHNEMFLAQ